MVTRTGIITGKPSWDPHYYLVPILRIIKHRITAKLDQRRLWKSGFCLWLVDLMFHYHNAFLCLCWQRRLKALRPTAIFIIFISSDPIDSASWIVKIESFIYSFLLIARPSLLFLIWVSTISISLFCLVLSDRSTSGPGLIWKDQIDYWGQPWGNMIYIAGVLWLRVCDFSDPRSAPARFVWSQKFSARCEHCCNFISRWPPEMMTLHPNVYAPVSWKLRAIFCLISVLFLIVIFSRLK